METKQLKQAIGYARVSTKEQGDKFGIEAQKSAIEEYARSHDYEIIDYTNRRVNNKKRRTGVLSILRCFSLMIL